MIRRCHDPKMKGFPRYGGRGISVCQRWRDDFLNFVADMGDPPSLAHQIDRIDNDGNYEPQNCHWATPLEQAAHTRKTKLLNGAHAAEWARRTGIKQPTLAARLRGGDSLEEAITKPVAKTGSRYQLTFQGRTGTMADWARWLGMSLPKLSWRFKMGWSLERALTVQDGRQN